MIVYLCNSQEKYAVISFGEMIFGVKRASPRIAHAGEPPAGARTGIFLKKGALLREDN